MFTIDASVWISAELPNETEHPACLAFLDCVAKADARIAVPTLLLAEAAAAISRVRRDSALAIQYCAQLVTIPSALWVGLDANLAQRALKLAADNSLRGADAVYAAVALSHQCELITLDRQHLQRLAGVLPVRTPRDAVAHHWQIVV